MRFMYATVPDHDTATHIAKTLVKEKLVACVNIIDQVHSIYEWGGEMHDERDVVLIMKTVPKKVSAVTQRVISLHPYECPCVVSLKIDAGHKDFLKWVENSTKLPY